MTVIFKNTTKSKKINDKSNKLDTKKITVRLTEVTKTSGICTKEIELDKEGKLIKNANNCWISEGTLTVKEIQANKFAEYIRSLNHPLCQDRCRLN